MLPAISDVPTIEVPLEQHSRDLLCSAKNPRAHFLCQSAKSRRASLHGSRLRRRGVFYVDEFYVEDQVGFGGDLVAAFFSVGELIGDEQTALAADAHSFEAGVPAGDHFAFALFEAQGLRAVAGGVELGAVVQPAGCIGPRRFSQARPVCRRRWRRRCNASRTACGPCRERAESVTRACLWQIPERR